MQDNHEKRGNQPTIIIGLIASLIGIFAFFTGISSLPQILAPALPNRDDQSQLSATATGYPPAEFFGTWVNVDQQTQGIRRIAILANYGLADVKVYGACVPTDCDWSEYKPTPKIVKSYDPQSKVYRVIWIKDFADHDLRMQLTSDNKLKILTSVHFRDNSGRQDYEISELFVRQ